MARNTDRNSYSSIFKAIGLFGGTKVFQILIGIIKNKIVAVLLGPVGMGVNGLLTTNTGLIKSLTDLGLHTSAVRDVAKAYETKDQKRIGTTIAILRKLVWLTGLLGALIVFLFAKELSVQSFGNSDFTFAFQVVAITLLFDQVCVGQTVLMQGTFHYRYMARSALLGSVVGLVISIPFYYLWGMDAIAPVIVITSLTHLLLSWYFSRRIPIEKVRVTPREVLKGGKVMITLGLAFALTGILRYGKSYVTQIFISGIGSIDDVGLYTAGMTIATQYINVILNAMGSDYSPRLSAIADQEGEFLQTMNRQNQLMLTVIVPVIVAFIVLIKPLIVLLYSSKFLDLTGMVDWMMLGMFFRATSWCLSFAFIAKGESKLFFWNEFASACYGLVLLIAGYKLMRFEGLGIAYFLTYIIYTLQVYIICRKKYSFRYTSDNKRLIVIQGCLVVIAFIILKVLGFSMWRYIVGGVILSGCLYYSYIKLDEMIPVRNMISSIKGKLKFKRN